MRRIRLWLLLLAAVLPAASQHGHATAQPLKGLYITFHGRLKALNKKSILIEEDSGKIMTFRRDKKTKFAEGNTFIKPTDVDLESLVTIFATEDNDLKLIAAGVLVDPSQKKRTPKSR